MRPKLLWWSVVLLIIWTLKAYYSGAGADDLWWMLRPTAQLAGWATRASFLLESGVGYLSREHLFLIEKSCAGLNFMIAAFAMLTFVYRRHVRSFSAGALVIASCLLAAYSAAVVANAARIAVAIWLRSHPVPWLDLGAARTHRLEGVIVYFAGMVLLYELVLVFERGPLCSRDGGRA